MLTGLTNLKGLALNGTGISDLTILSGLTNLNALLLRGNNLTDISALSGFTNLSMLDLHSNPLGEMAICTHIPLITTNNPGIDLQYTTTGLIDTDSDGEWDICDPDIDGDGIFNEVDTDQLVFSNGFSDGTTYGTITTHGDQILQVADSTQPSPDDGVTITVVSSSGPLPATVNACEGIADTVIEQLDVINDEVTVTCGSSTVTVNSGTVEITFLAADGTTSTASLSAGNTLTLDPAVGTITAPSSNTETVVVLVDGTELSIQPGETVYMDDLDGDGYTSDVDCNDNNAAINPGATEVCDNIDNNCDGIVDEGSAVDAATWYQDNDYDGYGNPGLSTTACTQPADYVRTCYATESGPVCYGQYVTDNTDCNDNNAVINPGAPELCDGLNNDCDNWTDEKRH